MACSQSAFTRRWRRRTASRRQLNSNHVAWDQSKPLKRQLWSTQERRMKARLTSATRPTALAIGVAAAVSLVFGSAAAAGDYPAVTYERLTAAQSDPGWLTY